MIGRWGSTEAMAWRTCASDRLAPGAVTTTMSWRKCEPGSASVCPFLKMSYCASGRKKKGPTGLSKSKVQIAGVLGDAYNFVLTRSRIHSGTSEILPDGVLVLEKLARKRSLMTATCCEFAVSSSEMPRPLRMGFPTASKYPCVTRSQKAKLSSRGPGAGRPSTQTPPPQLLPLNGEYMATATADTPGMPDRESWMRWIKRRELVRPITGEPGIDIHDGAPVLGEAELLILKIVQSGGKQS